MIDKELDKLAKEEMEILNGTFKNSLANWYLSLIEDSVMEFIKQFGFDDTAIPEHYTEQPPTSLIAVKQNSLLLSRISNPKGIHSYNIKV